MRTGHPWPLKRRQEQQQQVRCYKFMHPVSDLSPESVTTSMPLGSFNPQKVVIVGASVHTGWAARGYLGLGASWGHHTTSRERKKTGGHLSKNTRCRYFSRGPHWPGHPGHPRYGNTTRSRFRSPIRVNLTLDMVVYHDRGLSTSARLAGACVVARLRLRNGFSTAATGWA